MHNQFEDYWKEEIEEETAPFWTISFSDMATILLTFFIMLYSFSTMNTGKAEAVSTSLQQQFGSIAEARLFFSRDGKDSRSRQIPEVLPSKSIPIQTPRQREINGVLHFDPDSHELSEEMKAEIREILPLLTSHEHPIEIRGHASSDERGVFRDAMDLGYARAYNVRSYLMELGIAASRIRINSLGDTKPIVEEDQKPIESCVEISIVLNGTKTQPEASTEKHQ